VEVGERKRVHVADPDRVPDAPERPPDFARMLRNRIEGATFASVEQYEFDRILAFTFERDDQDTRILAELFGDGNVAVCDANGEVIDAFETVRLKSRTVAPGAPYEYPESRLDPFAADYETFRARMADSDADLVRTLATRINFGGTYAEELCTRAGVAKTRSIDDATDDDYERLFDAIERLDERLRSGDLDPRIYREAVDGVDDDGDTSAEDPGDVGRVVDATPIPLEEREAAGLHATTAESFNAALDDYFHALDAQAGPDEGAGEPQRPDFEAEIAKRERIVEQQESAIEEFEEQAEAEREKAEALYGNYDLVDAVLSAVSDARDAGHGWAEIAERFEAGAKDGIDAAAAVADVDEAAGTVSVDLGEHVVALDPDAGVEKNADRLYREAKRIEEKREGAEEAVAETRAELAEWQERRDEWDASDDGTAGSTDGDDDPGARGESDGDSEGPDTDWLAEASIPVRRPEHWYEQFRWFHTSDGFLVLGGRDAEDNEALVAKYLEPGDRFLHAQASGGPVTVLKATGPSEAAREVDFPDSTLEQAAQFAVSYSSVWKDGHHSGDAYLVRPDQVSKTPESGEYLETGGFAVRGERTYFEDVPVGVAVGIQCADETRVIGGPPEAVESRLATGVRVEPGRFAQGDVAKRIYRQFREQFTDTSFVRKIASPDRIQHFLPPGTSRIADD
jgi:predicted ribosome quality control (RQC) complex YloA/Tae2 family protein